MDAPREVASGKFTLYETPGGGIRIDYLVNGEDDSQHFDIPAGLMTAARMASKGGMNPAKLMRLLGGKA